MARGEGAVGEQNREACPPRQAFAFREQPKHNLFLSEGSKKYLAFDKKSETNKVSDARRIKLMGLHIAK